MLVYVKKYTPPSSSGYKNVNLFFTKQSPVLVALEEKLLETKKIFITGIFSYFHNVFYDTGTYDVYGASTAIVI